MAIVLLPSSGFDNQLRQGVLRESVRLINAKVSARANFLVRRIADIIVKVFLQTDVVKSLVSRNPVDLPAHFGLSDGQANALVAGMVSVLRDSVSAITSTNAKKVVQIRAIDTTFDEFKSIVNASYISEQSNIEIPVMEWMLIDPNIDIGQAAFDIVFKGEKGGRFDTSIQRSSRSGRAVMKSLESLGGTGGYVLPDVVRSTGGKNFIEFAVTQKPVIDEIVTEVLNLLRR